MAIGFVFPGQGSQSLGMLSEMASAYPVLLETFAEASDVLKLDLWQLAVQGPVERMNQTEFTQPLVLTAGVALWRLWCQTYAVRPQWVAGHSLGEYTALVAADALAFSEAVSLAALRGRLMQEAVPAGVGAMAAVIGLDVKAVEALCDECRGTGVLSVANINSVGQVVVSGHVDAVERAAERARAFGAKLFKVLPVSVPSHCALMLPAAAPFQEHLEQVELSTPTIDLIHNADLKTHRCVDAIRRSLVNQLTMPVPWVATVETMVDHGVTQVVECGPGSVLQGLIKRINKQLGLWGTSSVSSWQKLDQLTEELI